MGININESIMKMIRVVKNKFFRWDIIYGEVIDSVLVVIFLVIFIFVVIFFMVDMRCKDWIYLESFYFCFIIFSIIGLGDFLFFEDGRVEVSEYLMMVVGVILGFFMMFIMFCVFG